MSLAVTSQQLRDSACPLCRLFGSVAPHTRNEAADDQNIFCYLRAFSASRVLLGQSASDRSLDTTILGVITLPVASVDSGRDDTKRRLQQSLAETGYLCSKNLLPRASQLDPSLICSDSFDINFARSCVSYCKAHHGQACDLPERGLTAILRVIDCETRQIILGSPKCQYAALSYVWGPSQADATTDETSSVTAAGLPRSLNIIEDSIAATTSMGLRYLWIDRYCINQADEAEKNDIISQMDTIYANADITIIAAAGESPRHGLPGVNGRSRKEQPSLQVGHHHIISTLPLAQGSIIGSKWATRGWTYQEGILSRRRLVFTDDQVYFECNTMHCHESIGLSLEMLHSEDKRAFKSSMPPGAFASKNPGADPWQIISCIADFSKRELSFTADALNAMQGVFTRFANSKIPVQNILGVPILQALPGATTAGRGQSRTNSDNFLGGLTWFHLKPCLRNPHFPSWSWAGWVGEVGNNLLAEQSWLKDLDSSVSISVGSSNPQALPSQENVRPFSTTLSNKRVFLHIEAPCVPCSLESQVPSRVISGLGKGYKPAAGHIIFEVANYFLYLRIKLDRKYDYAATVEASSQPKKLLCVILTSMGKPLLEDSTFLLVEDLGEHVERVGIAEFATFLLDKWGANVQDSLSTLSFGPFPSFVDKAERRTIRLG